MRLVPLLLLAAGLLIAADFRHDRIDLKPEELEGTWTLLTVEWLGEKTDQLWEVDRGPYWDFAEARELPKHIIKDRMTITFHKRKLTVWQKALDGRPICCCLVSSGFSERTYEIDRTKQLPILKTYHGPDEAPLREEPLHAIFEVDGDVLQLCYRDDGNGLPLPRSFSTETDPDVYLLTFRRSRS